MRRSVFLTVLVALVISGAIAQSADVSVTGKAGQTERSGQPINDATLEGDRLTFSVTPPAGEKGPIWKFDLKVSGTRMEGRAEGANGDHSLGSTDVVMNRSK